MIVMKSLKALILTLILSISIAGSAQNWTEIQKVLPPNDSSSPVGGQGDEFGRSIAVSGDYAVVSAPEADNGSSSSGSVFLYERSGGTWSFTAEITASDGAQDHLFGLSLAMKDSVMIIGAPGASPLATGSGAAYIYRLDNTGTWVEEAKIFPAVGSSYDQFGFSVDIDDDIAVAGANFDDDNGTQSGSAYVFEYDGSTWVEIAQLLASDGAYQDQFGRDIAVDDTLVVAGAFSQDGFANNGGAIYAYRRDGYE